MVRPQQTTTVMVDKWSRSREYIQRARQSLAGGVSSPFRAKAPIPLYLEDACGSRIRDVDGNEYIDYSLAWGPLILGHRHPSLVETLRAQAERPHIYGAQHELEFHLAETLQRLITCAERLAFTSSGSEAVQIALRLARAFTRRPLIVKFEGHYHGWMDSVLLSYKPDARQLASTLPARGIAGSIGQVGNAADNVLIAPWNDLDAVEKLFDEHPNDIAAVITEPVACNSGCLLPAPGYLEGLTAVVRRHGALLIFDEVITGFRLSLGGAQALYGVTPDLATLGKAIAGGLPLSVLAGRREILDMMSGGGVAFGGTFNGNPISLAAAATTIQELSRDNGRPLEDAKQIGESIMRGLETAAREHGLPLVVTGFGTAFALHFQRGSLRSYRDTLEDDRELLDRCLLAALAEGINILPDGRLYVSTAHSERDADETVSVMRRVFQSLIELTTPNPRRQPS
jgi:glutamate-1-semialdehyde 2,1-aminomutase